MQGKYNINTGNQAEKYVAEELAKLGIWVGSFNKNNSGSQPFDQIAISKNFTWCYDVKHTEIDRFDFRRIEDNQQIVLAFIHERLQNPSVIEGFAIVYEDNIYFYNYYTYLQHKLEGRKSVKINELENFIDILYRIGEVE